MAKDKEKDEFDATVYGLMRVPKENIKKPRKYVNKKVAKKRKSGGMGKRREMERK